MPRPNANRNAVVPDRYEETDAAFTLLMRNLNDTVKFGTWEDGIYTTELNGADKFDVYLLYNWMRTLLPRENWVIVDVHVEEGYVPLLHSREQTCVIKVRRN